MTTTTLLPCSSTSNLDDAGVNPTTTITLRSSLLLSLQSDTSSLRRWTTTPSPTGRIEYGSCSLASILDRADAIATEMEDYLATTSYSRTRRSNTDINASHNDATNRISSNDNRLSRNIIIPASRNNPAEDLLSCNSSSITMDNTSTSRNTQ